MPPLPRQAGPQNLFAFAVSTEAASRNIAQTSRSAKVVCLLLALSFWHTLPVWLGFKG